MSFVVHTEKLNLVSAVAEAEHDEEELQHQLQQQQQPQQTSVRDGSVRRQTSTESSSMGKGGETAFITPVATSSTPPRSSGSGGAATTGVMPSHAHELWAVFHLLVPTTIIQLGATFPGFFTASYIGRNLGVVSLDGFTLAILTGNLFTLSLMQGLFSASDTLSPQAYGAGNKAEVGLLAIRGYVGCLTVTVPIVILLAICMDRVLVAVGEDPEVAGLAWHWYRIYALSLPFYALYNVTWKFLSAQNVMMPLTVCVLLSCGMVLPLALTTLGSWLGYWGTAIAIVVYLIFQSLSLIGYLWYFQPHYVDTWPGLRAGWKPAMQWKPFKTYFALGVGGILASSEWIYWETLSMIIGTFGKIPLSVHTIPTQMIMVTFMPALSLGISLAIRLGATLPVSVRRAKRLVKDCYILSTFVFGAFSLVIYASRQTIFSWFTTSEAVVAGCEEIWWKVCFYFFLLCIYGVHMGACIGLGMQWTLGISTFLVLWIFGLPAAYYASVTLGGGLVAAWTWVWPPYVFMNIYLAGVIVRADWDDIAEQIRIREGMELVSKRPSFVEAAPFVGDYGAVQNGT